MSLKLAIFDLDGTLVDSRQIIQAAMVRAFESVDLAPPSYDQTRHIVGLSLQEACQRLLSPKADADLVGRVTDKFRLGFVELRAEGQGAEPLYPGAADLVTSLADQGWLLAVATGKSRRGIEAFCERHDMAHLFDTSWCADDGPGKPHPFMVIEAMKAVGSCPQQSLMIGDATFDMQMGRAAGVFALGVSWGFSNADELVAAGAYEVHHDFNSLGASLERFSMRVTE